MNEPELITFTDPLLSMVAIAVLLLLQVPPALPVLVNGVDKPEHTDAAPLTVPAFGTAFTVTVYEAEELAQEDVTV